MSEKTEIVLTRSEGAELLAFLDGLASGWRISLKIIGQEADKWREIIESKLSSEPVECGECEVCHGSGCYETGFRNCQACNGTGKGECDVHSYSIGPCVDCGKEP